MTHGGVRHRRRAAAAATLADQFGQLLDRGHSGASIDVGYAGRGVDVNAQHVGVLEETSNEVRAGAAAEPPDRHAERGDVVASLLLGASCVCQGAVCHWMSRCLSRAQALTMGGGIGENLVRRDDQQHAGHVRCLTR
jgi:hypothetical protein